MKPLNSLTIFGVVLFAGLAVAQDKNDVTKQILGKWEAKQRVNQEDVPIVVEFMAGGKMNVSVKSIKLPGTYTLTKDGNLETETTFQGKVNKIKQEVKVAADTLEIKDPTGLVTKFKRVK